MCNTADNKTVQAQLETKKKNLNQDGWKELTWEIIQQTHTRKHILGSVRTLLNRPDVCWNLPWTSEKEFVKLIKLVRVGKRKAHLKIRASVSQPSRYGRNGGNPAMFFISPRDHETTQIVPVENTAASFKFAWRITGFSYCCYDGFLLKAELKTFEDKQGTNSMLREKTLHAPPTPSLQTLM